MRLEYRQNNLSSQAKYITFSKVAHALLVNPYSRFWERLLISKADCHYQVILLA